jgi:DNA-binding response OmpR family regulator
MKALPLIFVIDDDPLILKLIQTELKALNINVVSFSYGEDAIEQLFQKPDLIILDYIFVKRGNPVLGGLEILQEIRKTLKDVPVIILSGQESGSAVLELIKLGIEEYIIKEENFTVKLKDAINTVLFQN